MCDGTTYEEEEAALIKEFSSGLIDIDEFEAALVELRRTWEEKRIDQLDSWG